LGFDLTRAVTCAVLILVLGRPVLAALRRASRRAAFEPQIDFLEEPASDSGQ
jgi:energy-coupling factor transport system substrate-specific component